MKHRRIAVDDLVQQGYAYLLTEPTGRNFHPEFRPELTPKQMLALGVFGGKYMTDCASEYPADWFESARLCPERHKPELNHFGVNTGASASIAAFSRDCRWPQSLRRNNRLAWSLWGTLIPKYSMVICPVAGAFPCSCRFPM